jgi:hypothetical protein
MQRKQCQSRPRWTTDRDTERQLSDYTAGLADGESDSADTSLSTE